MPPDTAALDPDNPPSPHGGWSGETVTLERALVIPPGRSGLVQACGVLDADGGFCAHSATWRGRRRMMTAPEPPAGPVELLKGRHLFAGQIWTHFGHFLAESLSRLWALDHLKIPVEGIVFIPKRPSQNSAPKGYQKEFLELLDVNLPIRVLTRATRVEQLVVPGQGFGLGPIAAGSEQFRRYFADHFARDVAPAGHRRIYLSRTRLGGLEGSVVCEDVLERNLAREGYVPYHPQQHSIRDQIAQYRAAERVIGLDGSAFHLFAMAGNRTARVAIVLRRTSNVFNGLMTHIQGFTGIAPQVFSALTADWIPQHKTRPGRYSFGVLDFEALRRDLAASGLVESGSDWDVPRFRDIRQAMARHSRKKGLTYVRVKSPPLQVAPPTGGARAAP